ncbi:MAG: ketoacyl-ACP synthase III [Chloroflexi bacterium]|nr:ketoacyl-ACP synthase III [Chloroflexota bacterium]MCI0576254.1 ketoacyl-ACP synthase III [Chloroflexota bacterium]MCI0644550.1 ketoacyl-ACP synthase III [Chloroflexota bacterium]MCI0728761.1 ketoacyl-ACP synthase III [Chloroflexota bacterium]
MKYAHIVGWGSYLPTRVLTNDEIARTVDTSDEWIYSRTGIRERRIAGSRETTATLAFEAAARALAVADMHPSQVELIIVATSTPEYIFPSTACRVQDYLGASRAGAFDLSAACSGFVYALSMAAQALATESVRNAVVIGAETMSRVLDWNDRGTCILFGDGAGAVVLKGSSIPGGVLASTLRSDGSGGELLSLPAVYHNPIPVLGPEYLYPNGHKKNTIAMDGRQIFRFATHVLADVVEDALGKAGLTIDDVALIVPHQANSRIIEASAKKLKVSSDLFYMNVDRAGNTSAASIPIALCDAVQEGRLKPDDNVVFVGFGGGLTWAASVVKWDVTPPHVPLLDREWKRARYIAARGRSKLRRIGRRVSSRLLGSPTPDAPLREAPRK